MNSAGAPTRRRLVHKAAATLAVLGALGAFELFVAGGSFDGRHDPFTQSVIARPWAPPPVG